MLLIQCQNKERQDLLDETSFFAFISYFNPFLELPSLLDLVNEHHCFTNRISFECVLVIYCDFQFIFTMDLECQDIIPSGSFAASFVNLRFLLLTAYFYCDERIHFGEEFCVVREFSVQRFDYQFAWVLEHFWFKNLSIFIITNT